MPLASGVSPEIMTSTSVSGRAEPVATPASSSFSQMLTERESQQTATEKSSVRRPSRTDANASVSSRRAEARQNERAQARVEQDNAEARNIREKNRATAAQQTANTRTQQKESRTAAGDETQSADLTEIDELNAAATELSEPIDSVSQDADSAGDLSAVSDSSESAEEQALATDLMLQHLQQSRQMAESLQVQNTMTAETVDATSLSAEMAASNDSDISPDDLSAANLSTQSATADDTGLADPAIVAVQTSLPVTSAVSNSTLPDQDGSSIHHLSQQPISAHRLNPSTKADQTVDDRALAGTAETLAEGDAANNDLATDKASMTQDLAAVADGQTSVLPEPATQNRLNQIARQLGLHGQARHMIPGMDPANQDSTVTGNTTEPHMVMTGLNEEASKTEAMKDNPGKAGLSGLHLGLDHTQDGLTPANAANLTVSGQNVDKLTSAATEPSVNNANRMPVLPSLYLQNSQLDEQQMGARILMMAGEKWHEAELELEPQGMGKLKIQLSVDANQQTNVQFIAQNPHAKEILEQSLPKFREWLNQNGFQAGQTDVQAQSDWSGGQQQTAAQSDTGAGSPDGRSSYQSDPSFSADLVADAMLPNQSNAQGVDYYA